MKSSKTYRVTRSGRDVFVGDAEGLLREAREGNILANDLIFDPTLEKWVFARSLSLLAGFTLKGRRQVGVDTADIEPSQVLNEAGLHKKNRRRLVLLRGAGALLMFASTALLIYLLPAAAPTEEKSLTRFAEDTPSMRYEGSGAGVDTKGQDRAGPSNLDSKAVEIEATQGDPGRSGRFGRQAQLENPSGARPDGPSGAEQAGTQGGSAGGPSQGPAGQGQGAGETGGGQNQPEGAGPGAGEGQAAGAADGRSGGLGSPGGAGAGATPERGGQGEPSAQGKSVPQGSQAPADGTNPGDTQKTGPDEAKLKGQDGRAPEADEGPTAQEQAQTVKTPERRRPLQTPRVYDRPEANAKPPARLPVAPRSGSQPLVTLKASRNESRIVRARQLSEAMRTLSRAEAAEGPVAPADLLTARYQARMARNSLALDDRKHPDLETAETLIKKLSKAFMEMCTSLHSDDFCALKEKEPDWPDVVVRNVVQKQALVGMSKDQLGAAWGLPKDIRKERRGRRYCYTEDCSRFARVMGDVVVEVSD